MVTAHFKVPHKHLYRQITQNQAAFSFNSQVLGKISKLRDFLYTITALVVHLCDITLSR